MKQTVKRDRGWIEGYGKGRRGEPELGTLPPRVSGQLHPSPQPRLLWPPPPLPPPHPLTLAALHPPPALVQLQAPPHWQGAQEGDEVSGKRKLLQPPCVSRPQAAPYRHRTQMLQRQHLSDPTCEGVRGRKR